MLFGGEDFYSSDVSFSFSTLCVFGTEFFWIAWDTMAANDQSVWPILTSLTTSDRIFDYVFLVALQLITLIRFQK